MKTLRSFHLVGSLNRQEEEGIMPPPHNVAGRTLEPIAVIEDGGLNPHLACALKSISRPGRKHDEIKDLSKALWYLKRRIFLLYQKPEKKGGEKRDLS